GNIAVSTGKTKRGGFIFGSLKTMLVHMRTCSTDSLHQAAPPCHYGTPNEWRHRQPPCHYKPTHTHTHTHTQHHTTPHTHTHTHTHTHDHTHTHTHTHVHTRTLGTLGKTQTRISSYNCKLL